MCGKLPGTLALFPVLGPVHPHTIKPFLQPYWKRRKAGWGLGTRLREECVDKPPNAKRAKLSLTCFSTPQSDKEMIEI